MMSTVSNNTLKCAAICLLFQVLAAQTIKGDSLEAKVYQEDFLLYEPLVLAVRLHLDEPFIPNMEDPHEALKQLRKLRRRLVGEIREDDTVIYRIPLSTPEFLPASEPTSDFRATVIGFLGRTDERGQAFTHFERVGSYLIVVRDLEQGVEANPIRLRISDPEEEEASAADLFRSAFPMAVMSIIEQKADEKTRGCFERLASEYPETPYGKYAIVSLALMHYNATFAEHNNKGGAPVWAPVAEELTKAVGAFNGWHPLRGHALFRLALAQILAGESSDARRTAQTLCRQFSGGRWARKAHALLAELAP